MENNYTIRQLDEKIYTFEEGERVRSFLVIGNDNAVMIDTGNGLVDFEREIPKLTDKNVFVLNTHGDGDHVARNELFEPRYISEADYELMRRKRTDENEQYKFLKEGDKFDLGGIVLRVIETPGHTAGSVVFYEENKKWLFAGDTLTSVNTFMFSVSTDKSELVKSFKKLMSMELDVEVLFTCHDGCPITNYKELLHDSCCALEAYLAGEPETDIYLLKKGSRPRYVKRYIYGVATIIPEVVANAD